MVASRCDWVGPKPVPSWRQDGQTVLPWHDQKWAGASNHFHFQTEEGQGLVAVCSPGWERWDGAHGKQANMWCHHPDITARNYKKINETQEANTEQRVFLFCLVLYQIYINIISVPEIKSQNKCIQDDSMLYTVTPLYYLEKSIYLVLLKKMKFKLFYFKDYQISSCCWLVNEVLT